MATQSKLCDGRRQRMLGLRPTPHTRSTRTALTAELLWVAQSHSGDYHDNVRMMMLINPVSLSTPDSFLRR